MADNSAPESEGSDICDLDDFIINDFEREMSGEDGDPLIRAQGHAFLDFLEDLASELVGDTRTDTGPTTGEVSRAFFADAYTGTNVCKEAGV